MRKIRLMHLNMYVGYDGPNRGIMGQIKYINLERFNPVICEIKSTKHPELINKLINMGCEHICLNKNSPYDISIILKLMQVLKDHSIDILNTHNALACWYGNIAAKLINVPIVFTLRNNQVENYKILFKCKLIYESARYIDRITMKIADKIVAVSKRLEQYYISNEHLPRDKIITINNAIDLESLEQYRNYSVRKKFRSKIGAGNNTIVVGIVGNLEERKGHACLIEAAKIIVESNKSIIFLIIGDGNLRSQLMDKIKRYGIFDNFVFTGHIKNVFNHVSAMDIFVLPSLCEGISRALMESMAMGKPSVCSAISGNKDAIKDGETGLMFPLNDYNALADNLFYLIRNKKIRIEMGHNARERALNRFDIRRLTRKYEELYLELINI